MLRKILKVKKGQTAIELALLLPWFWILIAGLVDIGRYQIAKFDVMSVVRNAVRSASLDNKDTSNKIQEHINEAYDEWDMSATLALYEKVNHNGLVMYLSDGLVRGQPIVATGCATLKPLSLYKITKWGNDNNQVCYTYMTYRSLDKDSSVKDND